MVRFYCTCHLRASASVWKTPRKPFLCQWRPIQFVRRSLPSARHVSARPCLETTVVITPPVARLGAAQHRDGEEGGSASGLRPDCVVADFLLTSVGAIHQPMDRQGQVVRPMTTVSGQVSGRGLGWGSTHWMALTDVYGMDRPRPRSSRETRAPSAPSDELPMPSDLAAHISTNDWRADDENV